MGQKVLQAWLFLRSPSLGLFAEYRYSIVHEQGDGGMFWVEIVDETNIDDYLN